MKVVAFNGSPRTDDGNTALILNPFLEGMREVGAEVELFYTRKLKINPCTGEFHCWLRTLGKCYQKDDMEMVLANVRDADILVFATPVYVDGMTGPLKNLLDRLIPLAEPFFELRDGHCRHPIRDGVKRGKVVLVSNCGFWEMDNFDPLLVHMKAMCKNLNLEFVGALLRPHGPLLKEMMERGMDVGDITEAAREAGIQLIREGRISEETLKTISRPLMPKEAYVKATNKFFRKILQEVSE